MKWITGLFSKKAKEWVAETVCSKPARFEIEAEDYFDIINNKKETFYTLYVFLGEINTHDYLQETLDIAIRQAVNNFEAPTKEEWIQTNENPPKWAARVEKTRALRLVVTRHKRYGFYLTFYEGDRKLGEIPSPTLDKAKDYALQHFHVPLEAWILVSRKI